MTTPASLLNTPNSPQDWDRYSFDLQQNINDIQQALATQRRVSLPQQQIYPIPTSAIQEWLERVSTALGNITSALGQQAADVENVNLNDERERQAWASIIWREVSDARQTLKI